MTTVTLVLAVILFLTCVVGMGLTMFGSDKCDVGGREKVLMLLLMAVYSFLAASAVMAVYNSIVN